MLVVPMDIHPMRQADAMPETTKTGRRTEEKAVNWDAEIWVPCRLGESFTLWDLGSEYTAYLYDVKPDWMGHHGDCICGLSKKHYNICCAGAGPRPWTKCWNYEAKICITPPTWIWDHHDDTAFGLDLGEKRNGTRRQVKLYCVEFVEGKARYCFIQKDHEHEPGYRVYLESVPLLDPYFAPIWPLKAEPKQEPAANEHKAAENERKQQTAGTPTQAPDISDPVADQLQRAKLHGFPWFYYYTFDVPPAAMGSIDEWKDLPPPPMVLADIERIRKERGSTTNA